MNVTNVTIVMNVTVKMGAIPVHKLHKLTQIGARFLRFPTTNARLRELGLTPRAGVMSGFDFAQPTASALKSVSGA